MKPDAFQIFCGYYLGLDREFAARFFNIHSLAAHYGIDADELQTLMADAGMPPEAMRHIDFNVAKAHGRAQDLVFSGTRDDVIAFAKAAFAEFRKASEGFDESRVFEDVNYENIFDDPSPATAQDKPDNFGNR